MALTGLALSDRPSSRAADGVLSTSATAGVAVIGEAFGLLVEMTCAATGAGRALGRNHSAPAPKEPEAATIPSHFSANNLDAPARAGGGVTDTDGGAMGAGGAAATGNAATLAAIAGHVAADTEGSGAMLRKLFSSWRTAGSASDEISKRLGSLMMRR